jgi:hypothetical protein
MVVERRTIYIKAGRGEDAVNLLLAQDWGVPYRLYRAMTGRMDVLTSDTEWDSVDASNRYWDAWFAKPTTPTFLEQWRAVAETTWTREFFELVKP